MRPQSPPTNDVFLISPTCPSVLFLLTRLRSPSEDREAALVNFFTIAEDDDDRRSDCDREGDGDGNTCGGVSSAGIAGTETFAPSKDDASTIGNLPPPSEEEMEDVRAIAKAGDDLWRSNTP